MITECIELNSLSKHMKKVRSSHFCAELSKTQFFPVSIINCLALIKATLLDYVVKEKEREGKIYVYIIIFQFLKDLTM